MQPNELNFVRKCDHHVDLVVPHIDPNGIREFLDAINVVEPSLVRNSLLVEVFQPMRGNIVNTICSMIKYGVVSCTVWTLLPNRPDLIAAEDRGHIVYLYRTGRIVDHRNSLTKCLTEGDDRLLHEIEIEFDQFHIETNEWDGPVQIVRPALSLVSDTGTEIVATV